MDLRRHAAPEGCVAALRARGFEVFVADVGATVTLDEVCARPRVALVFGNEHAGPSGAMRAAADGRFEIPMHGMVESFNVSVAAAIALHAARRGREGDLGAEAALALKARFLMESVREPEMIVERYVRDHGAPAAGG